MAEGITILSPRPVEDFERDELDDIKRRLKILETQEGSDASVPDGTITTAKLADDSVTNAKLSNMAQSTIKGRQSGSGTGDAQDLTATQLNVIVGEADLFNPSNVVTLGASSDEGRGQMGTPPLKVKGQTLLVYRETADSQPPSLELLKRRSGTGTVLSSGDQLGSIAFSGADGNTFGAVGARINVEVDGTPGSTDMPGRIIFLTSPDGSATPTEAMRINSSQNLIIANGKRIETDEIRARDSDGLLLYDDGGNAGIFINDGGYLSIGGNHSAVRVVDVRSPTDLLMSLYNTSSTATGQYCGFEFVQDTTSGQRNVFNIRGSWSDNNDASRTSLVEIRTANNGSFGNAITISGVRVGIGDDSPDGRLDVVQSGSASTIPVLELEQTDLSEEFINFVATVGAGNCIDTAAIGTYYGKIRVAVNGTFKYIPLYNS